MINYIKKLFNNDDEQKYAELYTKLECHLTNHLKLNLKEQIKELNISDEIKKQLEGLFGDTGTKMYSFKGLYSHKEQTYGIKDDSILLRIIRNIFNDEFEKRIKKYTSEVILSEQFIDNIVDRIKRKQLDK
jgi:hypothetical protein